MTELAIFVKFKVSLSRWRCTSFFSTHFGVSFTLENQTEEVQVKKGMRVPKKKKGEKKGRRKRRRIEKRRENY